MEKHRIIHTFASLIGKIISKLGGTYGYNVYYSPKYIMMEKKVCI